MKQMMMKTFSGSILALILLGGLLPNRLVAQPAYCAIREPYAAVDTLFPEVPQHQFRSKIVKYTKESTQRLRDDYQLRFDAREFGFHWLYPVQDEQGRFAGLAHARVEQEHLRTTEVVVATDASLRMKDYFFQRCSSPYQDLLEKPEVKEALKGKTSAELAALIQPDGLTGLIERLRLPSQSKPLMKALLAASIKTLAWVETQDDIPFLDSHSK
jgi:hypothetical protein